MLETEISSHSPDITPIQIYSSRLFWERTTIYKAQTKFKLLLFPRFFSRNLRIKLSFESNKSFEVFTTIFWVNKKIIKNDKIVCGLEYLETYISHVSISYRWFSSPIWPNSNFAFFFFFYLQRSCILCSFFYSFPPPPWIY